MNNHVSRSQSFIPVNYFTFIKDLITATRKSKRTLAVLTANAEFVNSMLNLLDLRYRLEARRPLLKGQPAVPFLLEAHTARLLITVALAGFDGRAGTLVVELTADRILARLRRVPSHAKKETVTEIYSSTQQESSQDGHVRRVFGALRIFIAPVNVLPEHQIRTFQQRVATFLRKNYAAHEYTTQLNVHECYSTIGPLEQESEESRALITLTPTSSLLFKSGASAHVAFDDATRSPQREHRDLDAEFTLSRVQSIARIDEEIFEDDAEDTENRFVRYFPAVEVEVLVKSRQLPAEVRVSMIAISIPSDLRSGHRRAPTGAALRVRGSFENAGFVFPRAFDTAGVGPDAEFSAEWTNWIRFVSKGQHFGIVRLPTYFHSRTYNIAKARYVFEDMLAYAAPIATSRRLVTGYMRAMYSRNVSVKVRVTGDPTKEVRAHAAQFQAPFRYDITDTPMDANHFPTSISVTVRPEGAKLRVAVEAERGGISESAVNVIEVRYAAPFLDYLCHTMRQLATTLPVVRPVSWRPAEFAEPESSADE
eukprot:gnl/Chilomastix_cuspidata/628.p1 GENE.gnl/Chilomastix_cuspidata/628~~gnl/Chilomastix_cuspidata/628.p1  ORF type:complete len:603 (-),score=294.54 gnl/Chilomastix_cuspidata/628:1426-3036(-)